jgi:protease-4
MTQQIRNKHWFKDLMLAIWGVINTTRKLILNILFFSVLTIFVVALIGSGEAPIDIDDNSVLKLKLSGQLVDELTFVDPYSEFFNDAFGGQQEPPELLLSELLNTLKQAKSDDRIQGIILDLHGLMGGGLSKLQEVARAIDDFKQSEKPVIAYGDYFTQNQYYIAAHADQVFLHPMGAVGIDGFGRYRTYMKSALEKLKVNAHIFRVGTYKSAIEPYIRDNMSEPAKEANSQWLNELWHIYKQDIIAARQDAIPVFDETLDNYLDSLSKANGSLGQFAQRNNWVDGLMTHQEFDAYIEANTNDVKMLDYQKYVKALKQQPSLHNSDKIGVIVAKGTIYNGKRQAGEIGGDSTAALIKKAREDESIKAVVLRVDSPGGSAFASEVIRNELVELKKSGKPVVVSMSSLAASGGYWISASADEIWAVPTMITGSIGIFGMFLTFEDALSHIGIHTDGVGTTEMAGMSAMRSLDPKMHNIIQISVEQGYRQFLQLVSSERDMTVEEVDKIAQGRVWSGKTAL